MTQQSDTQYLMARVDKLERQARGLKLGILVLAFAAGAIVVMGQANPARSLIAHRLAITDDQGRERAVIQSKADGPEIALFDVNGAVVARVMESSQSGVFYLYGDKKEGVVLATGHGGGLLSLFDDATKYRADLLVRGRSAKLHLTDGAEKNTIFAGLDESGTTVNLTDHEGFAARLGSSSLLTAETGEHHKTSAASLVLLGKDGTLLWSAP